MNRTTKGTCHNSPALFSTKTGNKVTAILALSRHLSSSLVAMLCIVSLICWKRMNKNQTKYSFMWHTISQLGAVARQPKGTSASKKQSGSCHATWNVFKIWFVPTNEIKHTKGVYVVQQDRAILNRIVLQSRAKYSTIGYWYNNSWGSKSADVTSLHVLWLACSCVGTLSLHINTLWGDRRQKHISIFWSTGETLVVWVFHLVLGEEEEDRRWWWWWWPQWRFTCWYALSVSLWKKHL